MSAMRGGGEGCVCMWGWVHSSRHGSSQEFPSLVHSICTSSAPALEMHSAQVLEMLAQMECPRSVQVLQEMLCIQECVQECVT